jgi:ribosomal protein S12 methylthiotransferase
MLGYIKAAGYDLVNDPALADIIIVNTCGFITAAKEESIATIFEMAGYKTSGQCKKLVVMGCLSQRYPDVLKAEIPEIDILLGVNAYDKLVPLLNAGKKDMISCGRVLTTPSYYAYLRIADGCSNRCAYCAIPLIRGDYHSFDENALVDEAEALAGNGVKELIVIAQDTTRYGIDRYGKLRLPALLERLCGIEKLKWIRLLYTYPDTVTDELLSVMVANPKIVKYMDIPIQHTDDVILKRMNRRGGSKAIAEIVDKFRAADPSFILRTSIIVGFPGETQAQFEGMLEFLSRHQFDRIGAFEYSPEENTPAAYMDDQIDEATKHSRYEQLMRIQQKISHRLNVRRIGRTYDIVIESKTDNGFIGRSYAEAPEIDGKVIFSSVRMHNVGDFVRVRITSAEEYDLFGEEI